MVLVRNAQFNSGGMLTAGVSVQIGEAVLDVWPLFPGSIVPESSIIRSSVNILPKVMIKMYASVLMRH